MRALCRRLAAMLVVPARWRAPMARLRQVAMARARCLLARDPQGAVRRGPSGTGRATGPAVTRSATVDT